MFSSRCCTATVCHRWCFWAKLQDADWRCIMVCRVRVWAVYTLFPDYQDIQSWRRRARILVFGCIKVMLTTSGNGDAHRAYCKGRARIKTQTLQSAELSRVSDLSCCRRRIRTRRTFRTSSGSKGEQARQCNACVVHACRVRVNLSLCRGMAGHDPHHHVQGEAAEAHHPRVCRARARTGLGAHRPGTT